MCQLSEMAQWRRCCPETSVTKCQHTLSDHPRRTKTIDGIVKNRFGLQSLGAKPFIFAASSNKPKYYIPPT